MSHVDRIPKGLHHLEVTVRNKFATKYPSRVPHPPKAFVQARDRIARWNVVPGDKVRLLVGKPREKFIDETKGSAGGWKVYTVMSVDMERNRLYLDGLTNKKSNPIQPVPENIDEIQDEELKRSWLEQKNYVRTRRPVQYSNVQLCVEENGPESVFATRVATSEPYFNRGTRRWAWKRWAAATTRTSSIAPDAERGQVPIPWPVYEPRKPVDASAVDTVERDVVEPTLALGDLTTMRESAYAVIPRSLRAAPPAEQGWADEYVFNPASRADPDLQAVMPMYLSEELSPRFSRAKKQKGWSLRRAQEAEVRTAISRAAVDEWEAAGRDAGLEEVLDTPMVGLTDLEVRGRTRKEVREATAAEFDEVVDATKRATERARAAGALWDAETGEYVAGPKVLETARKQARKDRKARKIVERLERLTLPEAKNQVVPDELKKA